MPFKSMQELARAQADPRYRSGDKAYHEEIDRRLAVSLGVRVGFFLYRFLEV
jgi:hypothetical protein